MNPSSATRQLSEQKPNGAAGRAIVLDHRANGRRSTGGFRLKLDDFTVNELERGGLNLMERYQRALRQKRFPRVINRFGRSSDDDNEQRDYSGFPEISSSHGSGVRGRGSADSPRRSPGTTMGAEDSASGRYWIRCSLPNCSTRGDYRPMQAHPPKVAIESGT